VTLAIRVRGALLEFAAKAVPGASRDRIVGLYGDALKVAVAAPPEAGKANARIVELLAAALGLPARAVAIVGGLHGPRKTVAVTGLTADELRQRLGV